MSDIIFDVILACLIGVWFWLLQMIIAEKEKESLDRISDYLEDILKRMKKGEDNDGRSDQKTGSD